MGNANWIVSFLGKEYEAAVHGATVNIGGKIYQKSHPKLKLIRLIGEPAPKPTEAFDDMEFEKVPGPQEEETKHDIADPDSEENSEQS